MTSKSAAAKAASPVPPAPAIDPEALYRVTVSERFRFRGIGFGSLADTQVRGALLAELLADAGQGRLVLSHEPVEG